MAYICVTYGYFLQVYKGFWVDWHHIIDGIHIGKYYRQELHVIVSVIRIFKGLSRRLYASATPDKYNPVKN